VEGCEDETVKAKSWHETGLKRKKMGRPGVASGGSWGRDEFTELGFLRRFKKSRSRNRGEGELHFYGVRPPLDGIFTPSEVDKKVRPSGGLPFLKLDAARNLTLESYWGEARKSNKG